MMDTTRPSLGPSYHDVFQTSLAQRQSNSKLSWTCLTYVGLRGTGHSDGIMRISDANNINPLKRSRHNLTGNYGLCENTTAM